MFQNYTAMSEEASCSAVNLLILPINGNRNPSYMIKKMTELKKFFNIASW